MSKQLQRGRRGPRNAEGAAGKGARRTWSSPQLMAQGTRRHRRRRRSHHTLTLGNTLPRGHAEGPTDPALAAPPPPQGTAALRGRPAPHRQASLEALPWPPCWADPTAPQAAPALAQEHRGKRPLLPAGDTARVASSLQGPDSQPQAALPWVNAATPQHAHNTDRHGTEPHTCY